MNAGPIKQLHLATFVFLSALLTTHHSVHAADKARSPAREAIASVSTHMNIVRAIGTLLHIPYIYTLDSTDPHSVRLSGMLAAIPTDIKLGCKFFEKSNKRFFHVLLWDVPKFGAYSSASIYDAINILNPEHMVQERQSKGISALRKMKIEQSINIGIEFLLRVIACIAQYRASDIEKAAGGRDLTLIATLTTELADVVELMRLLGRYNTYSTIPGCDISWNFEIKHVETPEDMAPDQDTIVTETAAAAEAPPR